MLISSHRKLLLSKAMVVSVAETAGRDPVRQATRSFTAGSLSRRTGVWTKGRVP